MLLGPRVCEGGILADQLTQSQLMGLTTSSPPFSDLPTALHRFLGCMNIEYEYAPTVIDHMKSFLVNAILKNE